MPEHYKGLTGKARQKALLEHRQAGVQAGRRFARRSKMSDQDVYGYATKQAEKYGGVQRTAGKQPGGPTRRKELLSSFSRRTTESSRKRALRKLLGSFGTTTGDV